MTIKEKIENGIAVLTFKGDLISDSDTTKVKEKVRSLISDDIKKIIIDLGGVSFINSSGLGSLIAAMTSLKNADGEMRLARIGDKVENLFMITQLVKVFDTYETVERAKASFSSKKK